MACFDEELIAETIPAVDTSSITTVELGVEGDLARSHEFLGSQVGEGDTLVYTMSAADKTPTPIIVKFRHLPNRSVSSTFGR